MVFLNDVGFSISQLVEDAGCCDCVMPSLSVMMHFGTADEGRGYVLLE
jgi:hypothetical protein